MNKMKIIFLLLLSGVVLTGCMSTKVNRSSSIVEYLYPNSEKHIEKESIPHLRLPLRVGIAFVPENARNSMTLTEIDKTNIMKKVSRNFKKFSFVQSIEIIPSAYLSQNGSFTNLDQIKKMYNIDIIALVSFDQTQFTDQSFLSFTYWTIIGAYIIPAEKNDTHTMLDAVVYDINSRKMLFRAPGMHKTKSNATPINLSEQLRKDSAIGFEEARKELIKNLEIQLNTFRNKVKNNPNAYKVIKSKNYTGGGSIDSFFLLFLLLIGSYMMIQKREKGL